MSILAPDSSLLPGPLRLHPRKPGLKQRETWASAA